MDGDSTCLLLAAGCLQIVKGFVNASSVTHPGPPGCRIAV